MGPLIEKYLFTDDTPCEEHSQPEVQPEPLDEAVLGLLGDFEEEKTQKSESLYKDLAIRWEVILKQGFTLATRSDLIAKYPVISNCPSLVPS